MYITFLRSSSMGTHRLCEHQFAIQYQLGDRGKPNWRTEIGSMVHKGLELLARQKVAWQKGEPTLFDEEVGKTYDAATLTLEEAVREAFNHYSAKNLSGTEWTEEHHDDVLQNVRNVVNHGNGEYDPRKRKILSPELFFDFALDDQPWAWFSFPDPHTQERVEGHLRLKGTIDLVTEVDSDTLEYVDYKSGRMFDWAKELDKDFWLLTRDEQLLLYFLALTRMFPQYRFIIVTIIYSREQAPWTIPFDRDRDTKLALESIRKCFERIRNTVKPKRIWDNPKKRFSTCTRFCYYGKNKHPESGKLLCQHYADEIQQLGLARAIKKIAPPRAFDSYGSGGGKENRDG